MDAKWSRRCRIYFKIAALFNLRCVDVDPQASGFQQPIGGEGSGGSAGDVAGAGDGGRAGNSSSEKTKPGEERVVQIVTEQGTISIRIIVPTEPRYEEGAPVVVNVSTFFTNENGFYDDLSAADLGAIHVSYLWPGRDDLEYGVESEGTYDYGGPNCIAALRDVIRFASGAITDSEGYTIDSLLEVVPITTNVGLYAFSHPGIAAVNVLARYGTDIPNVRYFVGRENPTVDELSAMEVGHWGNANKPTPNPYYDYPTDYSSTELLLDYDKVGWWLESSDSKYPSGRPYFKGTGAIEDYVLGDKVPEMWGKRYYSAKLTEALLENGELTAEDWPDDVATPDEAELVWDYRQTTELYPLLATAAPELKVMLVFAHSDHVQILLDKPHIHQAYDGFRSAGLWVRLNPDSVYSAWVEALPESSFPDNDANSEPENWEDIGVWSIGDVPHAAQLIPLAAVAEMADRTRAQDWSENLDEVLVEKSFSE